MKSHSIIYLAFLSLFLFQCGSAEHQMYSSDIEAAKTEEYERSESEEVYDDQIISTGQTKENSVKDEGVDDSNVLISSSAAEINSDSSKKFIRTADIKFKVENVRKTTYALEDIIREFDGFVSHTNLQSEVNYTIQNQISEDSLLRSIYYTVHNDMVIRVPQGNLDTTLKRIAPLVDYLDYRVVNADEITFTLLANKLTKKRLANYNERLSKAIDKKSGDLYDVTNSEQALLNKQEQSDNVYIENLKVLDRVAYSTITLEIYQEQAIHYELIKTEKEIERYKPSFGEDLIDSLKMGGKIVQYIILFLARIWVLLALGIVGYIVYRRWLAKKE